jgi:hypothetical protein
MESPKLTKRLTLTSLRGNLLLTANSDFELDADGNSLLDEIYTHLLALLFFLN